MEFLNIKNLSFKYPEAEKNVLESINLTIEEGEFVVFCGKSGSGKTTLEKLFKKEISPKGEMHGEVTIFGKSQNTISARESAELIGFVRQDFEYRIATHSVRSELSFGLENLGLNPLEISKRVAETARYFSLSNVLDVPINNLSGGQKRLTVLAAICAMNPSAIVLDEPIARLDPLSAEKLVSILKKLCDEFGKTIIISEHRLENLVPIASRIVALDGGKIIFNNSPKKLFELDLEKNDFLSEILPVPCKIGKKFGAKNVPLTISEGRKFLSSLIENPSIKRVEKNNKCFSENAIEVKNLSFSYGERYVLKDLSLNVKKGEIYALFGENGSGKSTALKLLSGIFESKRGSIKLLGKKLKAFQNELYETVAVLPQNVESLFAGPTVFDDLKSVFDGQKSEMQNRIDEVSKFFEIQDILKKHPYDISGGRMQKAALAMLLLKNPKIIFLDEPTKGMDNLFKKSLGEKLQRLSKNGVTIFIVCHDSEFCARFCDRCGYLFDGRTVFDGDTNTFFSSNNFYTTASSKLSRGIFENAVTEKQVIELCEKNLQ